MKLQCKHFSRYLIILLSLTFSACISLAPPYQQIRYSTDPRIGIIKEEMNKEGAAIVLRIYIKDNAKTDYYNYPLYGVKITEKSIRRNTIVNEESISYDTTSSLDATLLDTTTQDHTISSIIKNNKKNDTENRGPAAFVMRYKDVKKIKLYTYQEIFGLYYKIYLYDKSNKAIFWFSVPSKNNGEQKAYKLLTALSVLIPHAQEEYIEGSTQSYMNPI